MAIAEREPGDASGDLNPWERQHIRALARQLVDEVGPEEAAMRWLGQFDFKLVRPQGPCSGWLTIDDRI